VTGREPAEQDEQALQHPGEHDEGDDAQASSAGPPAAARAPPGRAVRSFVAA
jgi:hypothetical protein